MNIEEFLQLKKIIQSKDIEIPLIGDSMKPLISSGEKLDVCYVSPEDYKRYDIIVYYSEKTKSLICHYYWSRDLKNKDRLITRALNSESLCDPAFHESLCLGMVTNYKISLLRKLLLAL